MLALPQKGKKGGKPIKPIHKHVKNVLPENHLSQHAYRSNTLGSFFNIKDQTKLEHIDDLTYLLNVLKRHFQKTILESTENK